MRKFLLLTAMLLFTNILLFSMQENGTGVVNSIENYTNQGAWADYFTFDFHYFNGTTWASKKLYISLSHANSKYSIATIMIAQSTDKELEITWENNSNEMIGSYYAVKKVKLTK